MSADMVPGAVSFSEWQVRLAGGIATCVEVSEMIVDHLVKTGFPLSNAEDIALATDLINRGQASANGATDWVAASEQMTRLGIPNDAYGQAWFSSNDFVPVVQKAIRAGIPVLFGFSSAWQSYDDWTQQGYNQNVYGHAIALVGMDDTGAVVADPNTPQATRDQFVHYSWANLKAAGGDWPSMVIPKTGALPVAWTQQADGSGKDDQGHTCGGAVMGYLEAQGLTTSDGLMSELFYTSGKAALPLASGQIVRSLNVNGTWSVDENGAAVFMDIWAALQAANAKLSAGVPDAAGQHAIAQVAAMTPLLANLLNIAHN